MADVKLEFSLQDNRLDVAFEFSTYGATMGEMMDSAEHAFASLQETLKAAADARIMILVGEIEAAREEEMPK